MTNRIAYQPNSLFTFEQSGLRYRCVINLPDGTSAVSDLCNSKRDAKQQAAKKLTTQLKVDLPTTIVNWRGKLQEYSQKMGWPIPAYDTVVIPDRPPHLPLFRSTVTVNNKEYKLDETSSTKKEAERLVSCVAYKALTGQESNVDQEVSPPTVLIKKEELPESDESDTDSTGPFDDSE